MSQPSATIVLGRISGVFGTRGWVKVYSYTRPRGHIFDYRAWILKRGGDRSEQVLAEHREQGNTLIARLAGLDDRTAAALWVNAEILVSRAELAPLPVGQYYWADLIGLEVETLSNVKLGRVTALMETGANDILVVRGDRERLIPFVLGVHVTEVDLSAGRLRVDWHPDD